jgi:hypothetical protein
MVDLLGLGRKKIQNPGTPIRDAAGCQICVGASTQRSLTQSRVFQGENVTLPLS